MRPSRSSASASRSRPDAPCWPISASPLLGIVGAGGIGQSLYENIRSFQYSETAAIVIIVVLTVMLIDLVSARLRKVLV
jgi:phosphonate transport system permease protein